MPLSTSLSDTDAFPVPPSDAPLPVANNDHQPSATPASNNNNNNGRSRRLFSPRSSAAAVALSSLIPQSAEGTVDGENNHPNNNKTNQEPPPPPREQGEKRSYRNGPGQPTNTSSSSSSSSQNDHNNNDYTPPNYSSGPTPPYPYHPYHHQGGHQAGPPHANGPPPAYYQPPYHGSAQGPYGGGNYPKKSMSGPALPTDYHGMPPYGGGPNNNNGNRWWDPNVPQYNPAYMQPQGNRGPPPPSYAPYPPGPYGHPHMDPRMNPYGPPPPHFTVMHTNKPYHDRSWNDEGTMDGKRMKPSQAENAYNRKLKSLGVLAEAFVSKHKDVPRNTSIVVDDMARMLSVERRRIYDVINILESVKCVMKKSKNTYVWMGLDMMTMALGELQEDAIQRYPEDALRNEIITEEEYETLKARPPLDESIHHKTLNRLTQQYLHVYLVGHKCMSLPEASDRIHGSQSTLEELAKLGGWDGVEDGTGLAMHKAASKGLKTKIRRLYDVSNVLYHMNWIVKLAPAMHQPQMGSDIAPLLLERRPQYKWNYSSAKEIRAAYLQAKNGSDAPTVMPPVGMKRGETKTTEEPRRMANTATTGPSRPPLGDLAGSGGLQS